MKKTSFILSFLVLSTGFLNRLQAQYDFHNDLYYSKDYVYEIGASLGLMDCFTDLGGKKGTGSKYFKDYNFKNAQMGASIYATLLYRYAVGLRLEATFGNVKASDDVLKSVKETTSGRYDRNLSFRSKIIEISLIAEAHPLYFKRYKDEQALPRLSPYVMGGIGFFKFNPQAKLNGKWIDLKPLSTEGQGFSEYPDRKTYKLTQLLIPVGLGLKYKVTPELNLSMECATRILFTDYLDDVSTDYIDPAVFSNHFSGEKLANATKLSDRQQEIDPNHTTNIGWQRGNASNNDSYFTFSVKVAVLL